MAALREAERGEKGKIIRELLTENPGVTNRVIGEKLVEKLKELGVKEDRDEKQLTQAVANEKTAVKKQGAAPQPTAEQPISDAPVSQKRKRGRPKGSTNGQTAASAAPAARSLGAFTLDDLHAVESLAGKMGGYSHLLPLVQFMASKGQ